MLSIKEFHLLVGFALLPSYRSTPLVMADVFFKARNRAIAFLLFLFSCSPFVPDFLFEPLTAGDSFLLVCLSCVLCT